MNRSSTGAASAKKHPAHVPWRTGARLERNRYKSENPVGVVKSYTAIQTHGKTAEKERSKLVKISRRQEIRNRERLQDDLIMEDLEHDRNIYDIENEDMKVLRIEVEDLRRRLDYELEERAKSDVKTKELEVENRRLRNELELLRSAGGKVRGVVMQVSH